MGIVLIIPFALFFLQRLGSGKQVPRALLEAATLFAAFTLLACEGLSLFSIYSFWPLLVFWALVCAGVFVFFRDGVFEGLTALKKMRPARPVFAEGVMLVILGALLAGTLATVLLYPPTNYDSQTYHMPRVFFWLKNASVGGYPTTVGRQLYTGPLAEYFILQFQALNFGSDIFANGVQWLHYAGCTLAVGAIAGLLGAGRKGQLAAALLAVTAPMAVMQARTTQNDLVAAFWCLVVAYQVVRHVKSPLEGRDALVWAGYTGIAAGAAVLTKNTTLAILAPFAIFFVIFLLRQKGAFKAPALKRLFAMAGVVVLCVALFCGGFYVRNAVDLDGDFLAYNLPETSQLNITEASPRYRAAAFTMNVAYNFGSQSGFAAYQVNRVVAAVQNAVGIPDGDPGATTHGQSFNAHITYPTHDLAANPLHCLLVAVAFLVVLVQFIRKKTQSPLFGYVLCSVLSFFLVCAIAKFTPDAAARYTLPAVMLGLAFVPVAFEGGAARRAVLSFGLVFVTIGAAKALLFDYKQPLVYSPRLAADMGREQAVGWWAVGKDEARESLLMLGDGDAYDALWAEFEASGAKRVGIYEEGGYGVYPLLYPLRGAEYDVYYINPIYHTQGEAAPAPEAIFKLGAPVETLAYGGQTYTAAAHVPAVQDGYGYTLLLAD